MTTQNKSTLHVLETKLANVELGHAVVLFRIRSRVPSIDLPIADLDFGDSGKSLAVTNVNIVLANDLFVRLLVLLVLSGVICVRVCLVTKECLQRSCKPTF